MALSVALNKRGGRGLGCRKWKGENQRCTKSLVTNMFEPRQYLQLLNKYQLQ